MTAQKRKAPATTQRALPNPQSRNDSIAHGVAPRADSEDWKRWRAELVAVQGAEIHPPVLRLLILNMAIHANAKTRLITTSVGTLADECSLSVSHTKRLMKTAKAAGLIVVVQASKGGSNKSTVFYSLGIEAIARGFLNEPGSPMNPVQIHTLRGFIHDSTPGSPMNHKEGLKTGEENPPGGGASFGSAFGGPKGIVPDLWYRLLKKVKPTSDELSELVQGGNELNDEGENLNDMALTMLKNRWREWPRPESKSTKGRGLGIHQGTAEETQAAFERMPA